jgi:hypothetical protein
VSHKTFRKENEGGKRKAVLKIPTSLNTKFEMFSNKISVSAHSGPEDP